MLAVLCLLAADAPGAVPAPKFAEGAKVGEVTQRSATVWTRLSAADQCDDRFQLPGVEGRVRVVYRPVTGAERQTDWKPVHSERDYTCQFKLQELMPGTRYAYRIEAENEGGTANFEGRFRTAPASESTTRVSFVVTTGHKYATDDAPGRGPRIYPAMQALDPDFFIHTGDVVYYDGDTDPLATDVPLARLHWHRLYSLPHRREFHRQVASYFMKDDHDIIKNDCWPGQTYGDLTFDRGVELFNEQTPCGDMPYRTVRWGKHLQVWLMEGREYRSPNDSPDGPEKTIWGNEQLAWLKDGLAASDATFKVVVSPTPIVGPDRSDGSKNDNHANQAFAREGNQVRQLLAEQPNLYVICGDRHWQYVSVDPRTGLREFSCGPSTYKHAGGWGKNQVLPEHRFLRVAGGFLSVAAEKGPEGPTLTFCLHDVDGNVVHREQQAASRSPSAR